MGSVVQDGGLFPHLTARGNATLMARYLGWNPERIEARLTELAALTQFPADGLDRYPVQLSGGQKQRVSLRRALMLDPSVLYFGDVEQQPELLKRQLLLRRTDGQALARIARSEAPPGIAVEEAQGSAPQADGSIRRLLVTLQPAAVTEDLPDGQVRLWLEEEAEPVTVQIMVYRARKTAQASP